MDNSETKFSFNTHYFCIFELISLLSSINVITVAIFKELFNVSNMTTYC